MKKRTVWKTVMIITILMCLFASQVIAEHVAWDCPGCGRKGNTDNYCENCAHPAPWVEGDWTWSLENGVLTISGTGNMGENLNGAPWEERGEQITKVVVEEGITGISDYNFAFNNFLKNVSIPASVTSISGSAFLFCDSLTDISVSSDNQFYCSYDGVMFTKDMSEILCYPACKNGTSYTIPPTVESIGAHAFYSCTNLTSIEIPSSVTSIGERAFLRCKSLKSVSLPSSVTMIGEAAFDQSDNLSELRVASDNQCYCDIDGVLFTADMKTLLCYPPSKAGNAFSVPAGVTTIACCAFRSSTLKSIELPSSVSVIGECAFYGCSSLKTMVIPSGVSAIEHLTFFDCTNMKTITIPSTVSSVGRQAFDYCSSLKVINFNGSSSQWSAIFVDDLNAPLQSATVNYNPQ